MTINVIIGQFRLMGTHSPMEEESTQLVSTLKIVLIFRKHFQFEGAVAIRTRTRDPRKNWGDRILSYTHLLLSIELHIMQTMRAITMVMRSVAMEMPTHAHAMCTRPFFLLLKGLGTRLNMDIKAQTPKSAYKSA